MTRLLPLIMIIWLVAMGGYIYYLVLGVPLPGNPPSVIAHSHVRFQVIIDNSNLTAFIPAGIGVSPGLWKNHTLDRYGQQGIAPIHTEVSSGIIHVEVTRLDAQISAGFVLKDFFNIWGKKLTTDCIEIDQTYCVSFYRITTFIDDPDEPDPRTVIHPDPSVKLRGRQAVTDTTLIIVNITTL